MSRTTAWDRVGEDPEVAKAEAEQAVIRAARRCKVFKTTATTTELKDLIAAVEALDARCNDDQA